MLNDPSFIGILNQTIIQLDTIPPDLLEDTVLMNQAWGTYTTQPTLPDNDPGWDIQTARPAPTPLTHDLALQIQADMDDGVLSW